MKAPWQRESASGPTGFDEPNNIRFRPPGSGVICEEQASPGEVIPAKAGISSASHWKCAADGLDSRFRGNDRCFESDAIPNDTTTDRHSNLSAPRSSCKMAN